VSHKRSNGRKPEQGGENKREKNGSTPHVLGLLGEFVELRRDQIDDFLDGGIEDFGNEDDEVGADQQHLEKDLQGQEKEQRKQQAGSPDFLPEGDFAPIGGYESVSGVKTGVKYPLQCWLLLFHRVCLPMR